MTSRDCHANVFEIFRVLNNLLNLTVLSLIGGSPGCTAGSKLVNIFLKLREQVVNIFDLGCTT